MDEDDRLSISTRITTGSISVRQEDPNRFKIEQNLKSLEVHTEKKRKAQEYFYNRNGAMVARDRRPVHERLGRRPYRFQMPLGTHTAMVLPKRRGLRNRLTGNLSFRNQRRPMFQRNYHNNQPFKLRRTLPFQGPPDLRVEVQNSQYRPSHHHSNNSLYAPRPKRFFIHLKAETQNEIAKIQMEAKKFGKPIVPIEQVHTVHKTSQTLHQRFSQFVFHKFF